MVEDDEEARRLLQAAGGTELTDGKSGAGNYEIRFRGPEGIIVDLGHWVGAAKLDGYGVVTYEA